MGAVPGLARGLGHMAPTYVVGSRDRCPTAHVARAFRCPSLPLFQTTPMQLFVIGGLVRDSGLDLISQKSILRRTMQLFGRQAAQAGHSLSSCSPYDGSADVEVLSGWVAGSKKSKNHGANVELHFPDDTEISKAIVELQSKLKLHAKLFRHPSSRDADNQINLVHSWLLAQLSAMERCSAIVTIGGNLGGSANLLLQLASSKRTPTLALGHIGGAADAYLEQHRYGLQDCFGDSFSLLKGPAEPTDFIELIECLTNPTRESKTKDIQRPMYFVSYSRDRPAEADFVETTLRRRNQIVFRDEENFEAGKNVITEIEQRVYQADVFLALWCREYACSPWCNDELELALNRAETGSMRVVLIFIDETRVVPKRARALIGLPARTRQDLEGIILRIISSTSKKY